MSGGFDRTTGPTGGAGTTTIDELVVHLREAGAKRVWLVAPDAFHGGTIPVVATYQYHDERASAEGEPTRRTAGVDRDRARGDQGRGQARGEQGRGQARGSRSEHPIRSGRSERPAPTAGRDELVSVFEHIGDRIAFDGREWDLEWGVEPAFDDPRHELAVLYDRGVERRYGDGFDLGAVRFVYEQYREFQGR